MAVSGMYTGTKNRMYTYNGDVRNSYSSLLSSQQWTRRELKFFGIYKCGLGVRARTRVCHNIDGTEYLH